MEALPFKQSDSILVLDHAEGDVARTFSTYSRETPGIELSVVHTLEEYRQLIATRDFDLVLLSNDLAQGSDLQILHELKVRDNEPSVLIISESSDPARVAALYNAGCQKFIVKREGWSDELWPAVRHLLRIRKLEEENQRLLAKLTEANVLLQEKNRRLDEFSGTVAHDIRGPLGGITMKLEYLMETYEQQLDTRFAHLLKRALDSAQRLMDIVQSMYEFAKLGSKATKMSEVNLNQLVQDVIADLSFDDKLDINIGIDELPTVWGSPELLRRIFINLISNAVKYNDKKQIIINVGRGEIHEKSIARFCEVYVEDNGPGIPEEDIKDIFSMFNRGAAAQEKAPDGSGIGLGVVQRIAELHFGNIRVESTPAKGAKFILNLPMERIDFIN